jgi:hypothetical protein
VACFGAVRDHRGFQMEKRMIKSVRWWSSFVKRLQVTLPG